VLLRLVKEEGPSPAVGTRAVRTLGGAGALVQTGIFNLQGHARHHNTDPKGCESCNVSSSLGASWLDARGTRG
jgi:hypothetical protein